MATMLLAEINWTTFGITVALMLGVSAVFGVLILLTAKFFEVKKDARIERILALLPKANCGGCGHAGCEDFAKALTEGKAKIDDCRPSKKEARAEITDILLKSD